MTPEQKQQAQQAIEGWQSVRNDDPMKPAGDVLAALLQEMIAAPEPETEPVARVTGYYGGYLSIVTVDGQVLSTGTALYAAPPHQSEHHLEMVNTPAPSVPELEEYDAGALNDFGGGNVGWWQDYIRSELGRAYEFYCDQLSAAPTPAEAPADVAREAGFVGMDGRVLPTSTALYTAPPAPSVPDGWQPIETVPKDNKRSLFLACFNDDGTMQAFDYDGIWQSERESWELPQDYYYWATALGKVEEPTHWMYEPEWFSKLNSAQRPAPPADLARDAERWLSEHDLELLVTFGMQADDCDADGHTLSKEQTRRLCELGVLRNVGFGRHEMTAFGDSIFGVYFSQGISLPLQTHAEYNAAIKRNKQKGGEA